MAGPSSETPSWSILACRGRSWVLLRVVTGPPARRPSSSTLKTYSCRTCAAGKRRSITRSSPISGRTWCGASTTSSRGTKSSTRPWVSTAGTPACSPRMRPARSWVCPRPRSAATSTRRSSPTSTCTRMTTPWRSLPLLQTSSSQRAHHRLRRAESRKSRSRMMGYPWTLKTAQRAPERAQGRLKSLPPRVLRRKSSRTCASRLPSGPYCRRSGTRPTNSSPSSTCGSRAAE